MNTHVSFKSNEIHLRSMRDSPLSLQKTEELPRDGFKTYVHFACEATIWSRVYSHHEIGFRRRLDLFQSHNIFYVTRLRKQVEGLHP